MRKLQANNEYLLLRFEHVLFNCQAKSPMSKWVFTVRVYHMGFPACVEIMSVSFSFTGH